MGSRRMGLGRLEALMEAVDRDLNLVNSTLTNCTITTTAEATFSGGIAYKRKVYNSVAQTAAKTLTTDDSGTLIILASTAAQIQVFNLPTIPSTAKLGTFFDFIVTVSGNSAAAGSYTINTGGHASDLTAAPTAGYDDFIGSIGVVDKVTSAAPADDVTNITPAAGEGTMVLADNTTNGVIVAGTHFRATAVAISTTTAAANVWLVSGTLVTNQATGFVTTNLFTAP